MITKFKTLLGYLKDKASFLSRTDKSTRRMVNSTLYALMENLDVYFFESAFKIEIEYFPYIITRILKLSNGNLVLNAYDIDSNYKNVLLPIEDLPMESFIEVMSKIDDVDNQKQNKEKVSIEEAKIDMNRAINSYEDLSGKTVVITEN